MLRQLQHLLFLLRFTFLASLQDTCFSLRPYGISDDISSEQSSQSQIKLALLAYLGSFSHDESPDPNVLDMIRSLQLLEPISLRTAPPPSLDQNPLGEIIVSHELISVNINHHTLPFRTNSLSSPGAFSPSSAASLSTNPTLGHCPPDKTYASLEHDSLSMFPSSVSTEYSLLGASDVNHSPCCPLGMPPPSLDELNETIPELIADDSDMLPVMLFPVDEEDDEDTSSACHSSYCPLIISSLDDEDYLELKVCMTTTSIPSAEDQEVIMNQIEAQAGGVQGVLAPSFLPFGPEDPPDPNSVWKSPHGWAIGMHSEGTEEQRRILEEVVSAPDLKAAFSYGLHDLPGYTGSAGPFMIAPPGMSLPDKNSHKSIARKARRWTPREEEASDEKLQPLADNNIIVPCNDPTYAQNLVICPKKDEHGNWVDTRIAINWILNNKLTPVDPYPIPLPERLFQEIGKARWLSKLDLRQGFLNIPIPEHLQNFTAFWWKGRCWKYTRMGYGQRNSPAHFQRVVDTTLAEHQTSIKVKKAGTENEWEWQTIPLSQVARAYIDDILLASATFEEHCVHARDLLKALIAVNLKVHPGKTTWGASTIEYLGHDCTLDGIQPSAVKIKGILALPEPYGIDSLRRNLAFCNFYRSYIPSYSDLTKPLTELLGKGVVWDWDTNPERRLAWEALKAALCKEGNALRRADPNKPFILHTDWSKAGVSAVLGQLGDDGKEYLISCISKTNSKAERNWGSTKGEMGAACWGVRAFRSYLHGSKHPFTLYTDHKALKWLLTNPDQEGIFARWATLLSPYDFVVEYKPGTQHGVADAPSRDPDPSTNDRTGVREPEPDRPWVTFAPDLTSDNDSGFPALMTLIEEDQDPQGLAVHCLLIVSKCHLTI